VLLNPSLSLASGLGRVVEHLSPLWPDTSVFLFERVS
jgi:hypothetical protein